MDLLLLIWCGTHMIHSGFTSRPSVRNYVSSKICHYWEDDIPPIRFPIFPCENLGVNLMLWHWCQLPCSGVKCPPWEGDTPLILFDANRSVVWNWEKLYALTLVSIVGLTILSGLAFLGFGSKMAWSIWVGEGYTTQHKGYDIQHSTLRGVIPLGYAT